MAERIKLFGAALDALDTPQRIALKRAWMQAQAAHRIGPDEPRDPYDAIARPLLDEFPDTFQTSGKMEIPSWFVPRPSPDELGEIEINQYRFFIKSHFEFTMAQQCLFFVQKHILPSVSGMFSVDHALTAGAYLAHADFRGKQNVTLLTLDSHFDAISTKLRIPKGMNALPFPSRDTLNCGNFIGHMINTLGALPENVIVIGPSDYPPVKKPKEDASVRKFRDAYLSLIEQGVTVIPKSAVRRSSFAQEFENLLLGINTPYIYVSLDADVGSCACMNAVRFMDTVGLDEGAIIGIARAIRRRIEAGQFALAGFDVAEVDVHLLGLTGPDGAPDRTAEVCANFVKTLLGCEA